MEHLSRAMAAAWAPMEERYRAYDLVLPGSPSFVCLASACPTHCCRSFSVSLSEREAERLRRFSGLEPVEFLECENGRPIELPLAQPYLLKRAEGTCALLRDDLLCGVYEGRPDACRLYPHFVLFIDTASGRPLSGDPTAMAHSLEAALGPGPGAEAPLVPVLIRHRQCPGFGGPPLEEAAWRTLLVETARLQYGSTLSADWPMA